MDDSCVTRAGLSGDLSDYRNLTATPLGHALHMTTTAVEPDTQLSLLPTERVPEVLRLDPETCRRGKVEIARLVTEIERRRAARHAA
jgi:hypothetical protein